jgi:flagellar hook protein FlgE
MIDSIYIAASGLNGHQQGLRVISNNVSNMNTAGYKASRVDFTDLHMGSDTGEYSGASGEALGGSGLGTQTATLDLSAGDIRSTGRDLDLAIDGPGFFVLKSPNGKTYYSKSGDFEFNADGKLVQRGTDYEVMARNASGNLEGISLDTLRTNLPKATSNVVLRGNIPSNQTPFTAQSIKVFDPLGAERTLSLTFTNTSGGDWTINAKEGTTDLGSSAIKFVDGKLDTSTQPLVISLTTAGAANASVSISLAPEATSTFSTTSPDQLSLQSQDGYAMGQITQVTFDDQGVLKLSYSNAQKKDGVTIAVAEIRSAETLSAVGGALFEYSGKEAPIIRTPGAGIKIVARSLELANVDLTTEFSSLILMQRGYQASSQVLTTANQMLQQLFEITGR